MSVSKLYVFLVLFELFSMHWCYSIRSYIQTICVNIVNMQRTIRSLIASNSRASSFSSSNDRAAVAK